MPAGASLSPLAAVVEGHGGHAVDLAVDDAVRLGEEVIVAVFRLQLRVHLHVCTPESTVDGEKVDTSRYSVGRGTRERKKTSTGAIASRPALLVDNDGRRGGVQVSWGRRGAHLGMPRQEVTLPEHFAGGRPPPRFDSRSRGSLRNHARSIVNQRGPACTYLRFYPFALCLRPAASVSGGGRPNKDRENYPVVFILRE